MISHESLPFAKVCNVCLLCLFVRASHIPWDLGMYQPCNLMKYYDVEAESGVVYTKLFLYAAATSNERSWIKHIGAL